MTYSTQFPYLKTEAFLGFQYDCHWLDRDQPQSKKSQENKQMY